MVNQVSYLDYINKRNIVDGLELMKIIPDGSISAAFLDPQYNGVMELMSYGNEGERQKGRAKLQAMSEDLIMEFIVEISRCLKPKGHLFLWLDSFHLIVGDALNWTKGNNLPLEPVSMCIWDKGTIGMGQRFRSRSEYAVVSQKPDLEAESLVAIQRLPKRVKGEWLDRGIPSVWVEKIPQPRSKKLHPHRKPIGLITRIINSVVRDGEMVLDPCAGSFSTLEACGELSSFKKIDFIGCDIDPRYARPS